MTLSPSNDEANPHFNNLLAEFYKSALTGDPLEACARALAALVPGSLHLAFLTQGRSEIQFATNAGDQGREFLLFTMGAADSHPLIYQTHGEVHAISDVLPHRAWQRRAMYQAARPFLAMEDALGTDITLASDYTFSTCAIRDSLAFTPNERALFGLLIPHLRTVIELDREQRFTTRLRESLHLISLDSLSALAPHPASLRVAEQVRALFPHIRPEANTLAPQIALWVERNHPDSCSGLSAHAQPAVFRSRNAFGGMAVCLPPGASQGGTILLHAAPETVFRPLLTPREREIGHWLCEGKTNAEIAAILGIRPATAKRHLENIYEKIGAPNRASAIRALLDAER